MLHSERKRIERMEKQEAAGQSFWKKSFDRTVRGKVVHAFNDAAHTTIRESAYWARSFLLRATGKMYLDDNVWSAQQDLERYTLSGPEDMIPSVIEAMYLGLDDAVGDSQEFFTGRINEILLNHRLSFELIGDQMVEFESRELHVNVVEPTLRLLAGTGFEAAETAYRDALVQLAAGHNDNAITDAGTALQEFLTARGCTGNSLGPLIKSAKNKGLIGTGHDDNLTAGISKIMEWVSADRSTRGDAHHATAPSKDDAWLTIHVVGALMVRLSSSSQQ